MKLRDFVVCLSLIAVTGTVRGDGPGEVRSLVERTILAPQQTLDEVQKFCASRIPPVPQATSAEAWTKQAEALREEVLARAV